MKLINLVPLLFAITVPVAQSLAQSAAGDSLTREDAIRLALQNSPVIRQAQENAEAARARIGSSRSYRSPEFSISGTYARLDPVSSITEGGSSLELYPHNNYDFHLDLRWMIYDFNKTAKSIKLAESGYKEAGDNIDRIRYNVAYQMMSMFDAILILHQTISVIDEQIDALEQHLDVTIRKIQAGTATDYDSLTTRVRIAVAQNRRIDALDALSTQEILFRQSAGLGADKPINLSGAFAPVATLPDVDSALTVAGNNRSELLLARDAENAAIARMQLESLGDKPFLALDAMAGLKNGYFPNLNDPKANSVVGLSLQIPIFNGHRTRFNEKEAEANLNSARAHTADIERQIESEVRQAIEGVKSSSEKLKSSDIQIQQAEMAVQMAKSRYEAGVATNLDLIDAETSLSETRLIRLRAQYNYTTSLNALDRSTGKKIW